MADGDRGRCGGHMVGNGLNAIRAKGQDDGSEVSTENDQIIRAAR